MGITNGRDYNNYSLPYKTSFLSSARSASTATGLLVALAMASIAHFRSKVVSAVANDLSRLP